MVKLFHFFHTVRYLRPVQIYGRIWFRFFRPRPDCSSPPPQRSQVTCWGKSIAKQASLLQPWEFCFLNKTHKCLFPADWNYERLGKLWLYNLHYFNDLLRECNERRYEWHSALIKQWIADNPPGSENGWDSYPLSLRLVNWVKWHLMGNELTMDAIHSLAIQARYLRQRLEVHLLGNHLWTNAKALIFAGLFFEGEEADGWLRKGTKLLDRELVEQVLDDGGHFERSPMYHAIILEDLLDVINISQVYGQTISDKWFETTQKMFVWLSCMCHPDGDISLFNDAALGIAAKLSPVRKYMTSLNKDVPEEEKQELVHLKSSGYIRCQNGQSVVFLDVGAIGPDYLPAHAHADTLSFEMSVGGKRFIVDSGTSCYGVSPERLQQRSTVTHNTVTINHQDSSEVWGVFRVARRARPIDLSVSTANNVATVRCGHDGYKRLPGSPTHYREWQIQKGSLRIKDFVKGPFENATGRFYFHPDVQVVSSESGDVGHAKIANGATVNWCINHGTAALVSSTYHPEFGVSLANTCLEVEFNSAESVILFSWEEPGQGVLDNY